MNVGALRQLFLGKAGGLAEAAKVGGELLALGHGPWIVRQLSQLVQSQ